MIYLGAIQKERTGVGGGAGSRFRTFLYNEGGVLTQFGQSQVEKKITDFTRQNSDRGREGSLADSDRQWQRLMNTLHAK